MAILAIDIQSQCDVLRSKLKDWERGHFAKTGLKASRKDIAANTDIATKYQEYERLRSQLSGKTVSSKPRDTAQDASRKRRSTDEHPQATPQKRRPRAIATPSSQRQISMDPPKEGTPQSAVKQLIFGPTPQKEGVPLGIFDHLPTDLMQATPSATRIVLSDVSGNVANTPSKVVPATPEFEGSKFSRTPMSEGRRFMLDMFVTPRHSKSEPLKQTTPSTADRMFQTPAFLRRHTAPASTINEEASPEIQKAGPWRRSGFGRSLSSMIQEIRKQEDDKLDREMDIMRQLEADDEQPAQARKMVDFADIVPVTTNGTVLDEDGFIPSDVEAQLKELDEAEAAAAEKSGRPLRIYKKKGLKRQTRRVNMRPVRLRAKMTTTEGPEESSDDSDEADNDVVPETQLDMNQESATAGRQTEAGTTNDNAATQPSIATRPASVVPPSATQKQGPEVKKKRVADRNNYCKLKIKNKNSKANGRGKFRRR